MAPRWLRSQAKWALRAEFTPRAAAAILDLADERYKPPPPLARTRSGRLNLQTAAYLLALRDALLAAGFRSREVDGLVADGFYRVMRRAHRPIELTARLVHPRDAAARGRWREHLSRRLLFRRPDWEMVDAAEGDGYAFEVRRCVLAEYMRGRGEQAFCQNVLCAQDFLMAQARGEVLVRARTIAGGDPVCDFRFAAPEPAPTRNAARRAAPHPVRA